MDQELLGVRRQIAEFLILNKHFVWVSRDQHDNRARIKQLIFINIIVSY